MKKECKPFREIQDNPDVIIFIDELHTIVGAGNANGSLDAANIFKPALSRGELQVIGATTLKEYKKYIEKDSALERRFQLRARLAHLDSLFAICYPLAILRANAD